MAARASSAGARRAPVIEYPIFREKLASLWATGYATPDAPLSPQLLPPLPAAPEPEAWVDCLRQPKHPVALALRSLKSNASVSLLSLLAHWLHEMRTDERRAFDGPAAVALLCARYAACGWLEPTIALRSGFKNLPSDSARTLVWAAVQHMPAREGDPMTPLQAALDAVARSGGDGELIDAGGRLAAAIFERITREGSAPADIMDDIVACIQDLVDMAAEMAADAGPPPASAPVARRVPPPPDSDGSVLPRPGLQRLEQGASDAAPSGVFGDHQCQNVLQRIRVCAGVNAPMDVSDDFPFEFGYQKPVPGILQHLSDAESRLLEVVIVAEALPVQFMDGCDIVLRRWPDDDFLTAHDSPPTPLRSGFP